MSKTTDLQSVITEAGGTTRVASACGLTPSAVSQWLKSGRMPVTDLQGQTDYAAVICKLLQESGGTMDEWDLRLIGRRNSNKTKGTA